MSVTRLDYAVVTPARNEERNLARLAGALAAQTRPPSAWIVVDDGSTDGTRPLLARLSTELPWLRVLERGTGEGAGLASGRREGRALVTFCHGVAAIEEPPGVVIKMDADIDFDPDHCDQLIARFEADPTLGIASGTCMEQEDGVWVRRTKAESTVWGAARAYRWDCVPDVVAMEPCMGWDGLDELRVQLRGMTTKTFVELPFRHNRPEGGREMTSLHHGAALGRASWYMGYRPTYLALRALYRARAQPAALGMFWGYGVAAVSRAPRHPDRAVVGLLRERQRLSVALRRGAPTS
jgi:glycosyltransferase involved in cell wall biosynthesis